MEILILGYSSIVRRRVVPALTAMVAKVSLASRRGRPEGWTGNAFDDYAVALERSNADCVYVSLPNFAHGEWVKKALESGRHVIVDKPALLSLAEAEAMLDLAVRNNVALAEATVFLDHALPAAMAGHMAQAGGGSRVQAAFSFPPLPETDFRMQTAPGGGAVWDLGPYAVATIRHFLSADPEHLEARILSRHDNGLPMSFAVTATDGGRCVQGLFGFDTEYQNRLALFGPGGSAAADRVFTAPPDLPCRFAWRRANQGGETEVAASDGFANFLSRFQAAVESRDWSRFSHDLLADARLMDRLRRSAGGLQ